MAPIRPLRNPPITEALADFRVSLPTAFRTEAFAGLGEQLASEFPKAEQFLTLQANINISGGVPPSQQSIYRGHRFKAADDSEIAQFRLDGFTYNRLKPYPGWDAFFSRALDLWHLYVSTASPEAITRVAVRYINHLELPASADELSGYLTAPPRLPVDVAGRMIGFRSRVSVHEAQSGLSAHVAQVCEASPDPTRTTVTLDIDAYKPLTLPVSTEDLTALLHALRGCKNRLFFGSITETTVRMYE